MVIVPSSGSRGFGLFCKILSYNRFILFDFNKTDAIFGNGEWKTYRRNSLWVVQRLELAWKRPPPPS